MTFESEEHQKLSELGRRLEERSTAIDLVRNLDFMHVTNRMYKRVSDEVTYRRSRALFEQTLIQISAVFPNVNVDVFRRISNFQPKKDIAENIIHQMLKSWEDIDAQSLEVREAVQTFQIGDEEVNLLKYGHEEYNQVVQEGLRNSGAYEHKYYLPKDPEVE